MDVQTAVPRVTNDHSSIKRSKLLIDPTTWMNTIRAKEKKPDVETINYYKLYPFIYIV